MLATSNIRPGQMAFLGESSLQIAGKTVYVQVLCWPTVDSAWSRLAQETATLHAVREAFCLPDDASSYWAYQVAPQLSSPLLREPATLESTLGKVISRIPLKFAVAVVEHVVGDRLTKDPLRQTTLFTECLKAYDAYWRKRGEAPAQRLVIALSQDESRDILMEATYREALTVSKAAHRLRGLEITFSKEALPPLPSELARVSAVATCLHLKDPSQANPIFDTVLANLTMPSRFHHEGTAFR